MNRRTFLGSVTVAALLCVAAVPVAKVLLGDGVADDTDALQALFATRGRPVAIPPGHYRVTRTIVVTADQLECEHSTFLIDHDDGLAFEFSKSRGNFSHNVIVLGSLER